MRRIAFCFWMILSFGLVASRADARNPDLLSLTVRNAVSIALQSNRTIQQAHEEVRRSEYRITEARSAAFPQVNGSWSFERNPKPNVFVMSIPDSSGAMRKNRLKMGTDYTSSLGATLTQPLYVGGKVGAALEAAKIYRKLSAEQHKSVRQNVIMGTMQAFNGALLAGELEQIARASLAQAENHLANVETRKQAGVATDYDLLRARVNAGNMRPRLIEAENNVRVSLLKLKEVLGVDPETEIGVAGVFAMPDSSILERAYAAWALRMRPEVAVGRLVIDLQDQAIQVARGEFMPTLAARMTLAYNGNFDELRARGEDWSTYWVAGLSLTFPIFTGFRNSAQYRQTKVDHRQAQTEYLKTQDAVTIEVEQAAMNFRKALDQIDSQQLNVDEAQRAMEIVDTLYANGKATQLEVLDVQLALQVARTNMASALYEATITEIALHKSLGLLEGSEP